MVDLCAIASTNNILLVRKRECLLGGIRWHLWTFTYASDWSCHQRHDNPNRWPSANEKHCHSIDEVEMAA